MPLPVGPPSAAPVYKGRSRAIHVNTFTPAVGYGSIGIGTETPTLTVPMLPGQIATINFLGSISITRVSGSTGISHRVGSSQGVAYIVAGDEASTWEVTGTNDEMSGGIVIVVCNLGEFWFVQST